LDCVAELVIKEVAAPIIPNTANVIIAKRKEKPLFPKMNDIRNFARIRFMATTV
jgi:hypothetical protein